MNRQFSQINKTRLVILCLLVCMTGACAETPVNKHGSVLKQPPSGAPGVSGKPSRKEGHLRSEFRRCISTPAAGTGYASWGSYGAEWMKGIAEAFVTDFNAGNNPKHTVQLKFDDNSKEIADLYRDATLVTNGKDHSISESGHGGIDEGVFYFHVGHGDPDGF